MVQLPEISRVPRSRAAARRTYNRLSRWYDLLSEGSEGPFTTLGLDMLAAQPGERVLELGYGTGHALVRLSGDVGATGGVVGVDLSAGMAAAARRTLCASREGKAALCIGDALRTPLKSGVFDAAFLSFTLELFDTPEIPAVLAECRRLLRGGGRLGVVALAKRGRDTVPVRLYEWAHRVAPQWVDCRPIPVGELLAAAGFALCDETAHTMWGLPVAVALGINE